MILGDGHTRGPQHWGAGLKESPTLPITVENSLAIVANHRDGLICPDCPTGSLCPTYVGAVMFRLDAKLPIGSTTEEER